MNAIKVKKKRVERRKNHIKKRIRANATALRLCISRSNKNFYAQIVDDAKGTTLVGISTLSKEFSDLKSRNNKDAAKALGVAVAKKATENGIKSVIFDRNGYLYHGKIKTFADSARENGLEF